MSLSETKVIDQITVTENGTVLYREATRILKDGEQIAQTFHRTSLTPAQDLTGQPAQVAAICNAAWTPDVIAAYQAEQERTIVALTPQPE
jgi:DNA-binding transcriptional LysR family regulator